MAFPSRISDWHRGLSSEMRVRLSLLLVPAGAVLLLAQAADPVDAIVAAQMKAQRIPGVAVAVVRRGDVVKAKGYGFANLEHQIPVTDRTIFQSGSVGKQFTATAVMLLVEDGTLSLSD